MSISRKTLSQIIGGHAGISPQMALLLAQAFPTTTPQLWLNLQQQYDLWQPQPKTATARRLQVAFGFNDRSLQLF